MTEPRSYAATVSDDTTAPHVGELRELIRDLAVVHGEVTLSSGAQAQYYVDLRRITLHHRAGPLVGQVMMDMLTAAGVEFDVVGGLTMGADPVATAMMHASAARAGAAVDACVVRKTQKSYGMGRQVEGPGVEGRRVVVVEDTSTTGQSALTAVEGIREAGGEVVAVAVILDRNTGAREAIAEQAQVPCFFAYSTSDIGL